MQIIITKTVAYKGGLKVRKGETFEARVDQQSDSPAGPGYTIDHPNFDDPKIRLFIPGASAREV